MKIETKKLKKLMLMAFEFGKNDMPDKIAKSRIIMTINELKKNDRTTTS